ncbi:MAG: BtaA family protein [Bacteroidia bacterium]|jgi:S-adenosylmethionine-diacylglycerol 3-amino-3-carboxypropyl transferase|nr:BtaA family protein [Bacteroidia bacterium]
MSNNDLQQRVEFDFIRYANCWEDADLLAEALQIKPGEKVLSIASAGDNSFALLVNDPELVVAVDVNEIQLWLGELKKAAFSLSSHDEFLAFLGFRASSNRRETYQKIRTLMPENARQWCDNHLPLIEAGVISQGKFERYFGYFRTKILPLIHSKKNIAGLFEEKTSEEQKVFYHKKWNTWRWRLFFKIFFSRFVMGKYGRDPEFMKEVKVSVSKYIFGKAEIHLQSREMQKNHFLHHILAGSFEPQLPLYARKENFERIKSNLSRIVFYKGYAEEACREYGPFDAYNLSNIFEYLSAEISTGIAKQLSAASKPGARFAYWNLMVPRNLAALYPEKLQRNETLSDRLSAGDKGFFYHRFHLDILK